MCTCGITIVLFRSHWSAVVSTLAFRSNSMSSIVLFLVQTLHCFNETDASALFFLCRLLVTGSVYLTLGFLYQRYIVGAQGLEQIPNYTFWSNFGSLQAVSRL